MSRSSVVIASLVLLLASSDLAAQYRVPVPPVGKGPHISPRVCPETGSIPNFDSSVDPYQSFTLTWDPPADFSEPIYEIVTETSADFCTAILDRPNIPDVVVGTTTDTTFTVPFTGDNQVVLAWVRIAECPDYTTDYSFVFDTMRTKPAKPVLALDSLVGRTVNLNYQAADSMSYVLQFLRQTPSGNTQFLNKTPSTWCPPGSSHQFTDDLSDEADGTWQYRILAYNAAGDTFSDVVSVTVGAASVPEIRSFSAIPTTIRSGQTATLAWSTEGANTVGISPGSSSLPANGTLDVSPAETTTYTLTAFGSSGTATETVTVEVLATPEIVVTNQPEPMVQGTSAGGATTRFVCLNVGGAAGNVTFTPVGDFFTISPTGGTMSPGDGVTVQITGLQKGTGSYEGEVRVSGDGVPSGTSVPVRLLSVPTPEGPTSAEAEVKRVDVVGTIGSNPTGMATFRNTGQATIQGTLVSTAPWLIPQSGLIEVDPGETVVVTFTIDRSKRPADVPVGSIEAILKFVFRTGSNGKQGGIDPRDGAATTSSLVTIVDTSTPEVAAGEIPDLAPGEVALFVPGVGHVEGSTGLFFSDLSLINLSASQTLNDLEMYFKPIGPSQSGNTRRSEISGLAAGTPIGLADVVKSVFGQEQIGSLQIRTSRPEMLGINANILSRTREDQKTFGATIPMLRSDRSVGPGASFFVTGLKRTSTSHTNLFIQETAGGTVTIDTAFFDANGQQLGSRTDTVGRFELLGLFHSDSSPILPLGAVSAVMTSRAESTGSFAGYATPVDRASGDFWSLVDWNAQFGFQGASAMLIPVAGALRGANDLNFRTDLAVINRGDTGAEGTLLYITRPEEGREPLERSISLAARQSAILEDVTTTLFDIDPSQFTLGFMKFTPDSGSMTVTSRNFATVGQNPGSFGTGVPTVPLASSMRLGEVTRIGGVKDSAVDAINAQTPGSFRSNFAIMETTGTGSVTVRVTLYYTYSTGSLAVARGQASKDYTLGPNQFMQLSRISQQILGASRDDFGDFNNLQADFTVVAGDGAATVFVSSVENDTGDSILRVN